MSARRTGAVIAILISIALSAHAQGTGGTPTGSFVSPPAGSGSSAGGPGGRMAITLTSRGAKADAVEISDASWSGSTVTITANDANFTAGDTGKDCFGYGSTNHLGGVATLTYISATQATCSALSGAASGAGIFVYGTNDTAAVAQATADCYILQNGCTIIAPCGRMLIASGMGTTATLPGHNAGYGVTVQGCGYQGGTTFVPEPGFNFSSSALTLNSIPIGCVSTGCFWNTAGSNSYFNLSINGETENGSGLSTAPASTLFTVPSGGLAQQLDLFNWMSSATNGPHGLDVISGTGPYGIGLFATGFGNGNTYFGATYNICQSCGGQTINVSSILLDMGGTYTGGVTTVGGGHLMAHGTWTQAQSGASNAWGCYGGGIIDTYDAQIGAGSPGASGIGLEIFNVGGGNCTVHAHSTLFNGGSSGAAIELLAGTTLDLYLEDNGNTFSSPMFSNSGTLRVHHREAGTCTFAASTTCTVTFTITFGNSTTPTVRIQPINPGATTFNVNAAPTTTGFTITASAANSLSVMWEAELN